MAVAQAARTQCPRGHEYTEANTYRSGGRRICRACSIARWAERHPQPTTVEKFWRQFRRDPSGCWIWTGALHVQGYGLFGMGARGKTSLAHRFSYELLVGPIPAGLTLDHECHNRDLTCSGGKSCPHRPCVNPSHLEPATIAANVMSGRGFGPTNLAKTECPAGHPYDEENTYVNPNSGWRLCRTCHRSR